MAAKLQPMLDSPPLELIARFTELHKQLRLNADEQAARAIQGLITNEL
jgi:lipid-A-disaccharide synthase